MVQNCSFFFQEIYSERKPYVVYVVNICKKMFLSQVEIMQRTVTIVKGTVLFLVLQIKPHPTS